VPARSVLSREMQLRKLPAGPTPMIYTEPLFLGVTPSGARNYMANQAAALGKPFYNACAGRFSVIETAVKGGVPAQGILASDISLFSSIIGYLADPSKRLGDLGISILDPAHEPKGTKDEFDFAAHVMLILKLNQARQTNLRGLYIREEILSSWERLRHEMRDQLAALVQSIRRIHYEISDIWEVVSQVAEQDVTFYASVPHYSRGYTRMFAAPNLKWNEPGIPEFDPKTFPLLLERLGEAKCSAFLCRRSKWDEEVPATWTKVYGKPDGHHAVWIISNRETQARAQNKTALGTIRKLPIYDDHEITPESKFDVILVGLPTALHYRDLFVHRLGTTTADRGFLLLVDGQVMTAFGIFIFDFLRFKSEYLPEMFGITRSSVRYHRLGKLFMLLLTSGEMKKRLCDILKLWLHEPKGIQTTSITVHEEGKTDRGALKLVSREKLDDGRFRIVYRSDFRDDSFSDVVAAWVKKHGEKKRI
jgi:Phage DNA Adenine Methylase-like domain 1/Phage GNAT-like domain